MDVSKYVDENEVPRKRSYKKCAQIGSLIYLGLVSLLSLFLLTPASIGGSLLFIVIAFTSYSKWGMFGVFYHLVNGLFPIVSLVITGLGWKYYQKAHYFYILCFSCIPLVLYLFILSLVYYSSY